MLNTVPGTMLMSRLDDVVELGVPTERAGEARKGVLAGVPDGVLVGEAIGEARTNGREGLPRSARIRR